MTTQKVTVHQAAETNTQTVARAKPQYTELTDSLGRVIKLRELDPLQQARLVMAVGAEAASNQTFMNGFALPAAMVAYLDGDPYGFPGSISQVELVLKDLGKEGMAAINVHILTQYETAKAEAEKAVYTAEQAAAKN